ncbi:hypothetical protein Agabi119p4_1379 [Agaricus bisporus var. burnettii]|uniref:Uncharacterized protein n=1 Tax=Agaricus bisporus var. burnettii TaxID=192524 RepID=A0A8H7KMT4_AGABI|nr:hypothetical protein Agabi119p4_1379 [Agaricus bisporus var. burnettii]
MSALFVRKLNIVKADDTDYTHVTHYFSSVDSVNDFRVPTVPRKIRLTISFRMDTAISEQEFKIPRLPPLRSRKPYVPLLLFAFPLPDDYLVQWAKIDIISSHTDEWYLQQDAWEEINRRRPRKGWCCTTSIYYDGRKVARGVVIADNQSNEKMVQAQDIDLNQQYRNLLGTEPGWLVHRRSFHMDTAVFEPEFKIPKPPPLRSRKPYVPLLLFAFPLPDDHLVQWAKIHKISSETDDWDLQQDAWAEIKRRRPQKGWCHTTTINYDGGQLARGVTSNSSNSIETCSALSLDGVANSAKVFPFQYSISVIHVPISPLYCHFQIILSYGINEIPVLILSD